MRRLLFLFVLTVSLSNCGRQMAESDLFIDTAHQVILKGDYETLENDFISNSIKDENFAINIQKVFAILDQAKLKKVEKSAGYSINIKNGVTNVESKYVWRGEDYDVNETIIVSNGEGAYKILGLNVKRVE